MKWQQWKRVLVRIVRDVNDSHTLLFAAGLSYYFVMALFPALIAVGAMVAYLPIPDPMNTIIAAMAGVVPPASMPLVRRVVTDVISPSREAFLSFGLLGTLWTCSSGFAAVIEALNDAYDVPETRSMWKTRGLAIGLTFLIGGLAALAFAFMIVGPRFGEFLAANLGITWMFAVIWPLLRYLLAVTFIVMAVAALYFMAPNVKQSFATLLPGAMVAVVGWLLLSDGLSFYFLRFAHLNRTYGALGGGVAFLTWLYWSSFVILLGAELNAAVLQERGDRKLELKQPLPAAKAAPPSATSAEEVPPSA